MGWAGNHYIRILAVLSVVGALAGCFVGDYELSDEAMEEVKGSARVVHAIDTSTQSGTALDVRFFVLDLGEQSPDAAVNEEVERLVDAGWEDPREASPGTSLVSDRHKALVTVWTLEQYLGIEPRGGQWEAHAADIRRATRTESAALIVVTAERNKT